MNIHTIPTYVNYTHLEEGVDVDGVRGAGKYQCFGFHFFGVTARFRFDLLPLSGRLAHIFFIKLY